MGYLLMDGQKSSCKKTKFYRSFSFFLATLLICVGLYGITTCLRASHVVSAKNCIKNNIADVSGENLGNYIGDLLNSNIRSEQTIGKNEKILSRDFPIAMQMNQENTIYVIKYDFDLDGVKVVIPERSVLKFRGGCIKNGTLVGNNTGIIAKKVTIFDTVCIEGTWNVGNITSDWFTCVNDNDLVQAFNLLSDNVSNTIAVEKRDQDYWVDCQKGSTSYLTGVGILNVKSNTRCVINGTIRQRGHHSNYIYTIYLNNVENVILEGSGTVYGEKELHNYQGVTPILPTDEDYKKNTQENNHIITVLKSKNVYINGLTLKDSTGDGIDILNYNENKENHIVVENFTIENCGRQGISVTGSFIEIKHGSINKVDRTMPMSGIDIEISTNRTGDLEAHDIYVNDVNIANCYTGIQSYTNPDKPANIHDVKIENVKCSNVNRGFIFTEAIKNVILVSCNFDIIPSIDTKTLCLSTCDNFVAERCTIKCDKANCRNNWGWKVIRAGESNDSDKRTVNTDFTLLRTGARASKYKNNKSLFKKCVVYSPYTNLIKRANMNTTIEDCDITCFRLKVITAPVNKIIKNSKVKVISEIRE